MILFRLLVYYYLRYKKMTQILINGDQAWWKLKCKDCQRNMNVKEKYRRKEEKVILLCKTIVFILRISRSGSWLPGIFFIHNIIAFNSCEIPTIIKLFKPISVIYAQIIIKICDSCWSHYCTDYNWRKENNKPIGVCFILLLYKNNRIHI